jgi:hypothetical protein
MSKRCRICRETKPFDQFHRANGMRDGYRSECKECFGRLAAERYRTLPGFRERAISRTQRWRETNPERYAELQRRTKASPTYKRSLRNSHLKRKYGITLADYEAMLAAQAGGCAICGAPEPDGQSLHVDHCHDAGAVRGLLCFRCNAGLGQFDHDGERLAAAAAYLSSSPGPAPPTPPPADP